MPDFQMKTGWERTVKRHVHSKIEGVADDILTESKATLTEMVYSRPLPPGEERRTGNLYDSGKVIDEGDNGFLVGYESDHARYVHEGESTSRKYGPRPFLIGPATRDRGTIK